MTNQKKLEYLVSPEKFFPDNTKFGNLQGNKHFIASLLRYSSLLKKLQYSSEEEVKRIQFLRLSDLLEYASRNSSFWHRYLGGRSFKELPVLYREKLQELELEYGEGAAVIRGNEWTSSFTLYTSGTTATPRKIPIDEKTGIIGWYSCRLVSPAFELSDEFLQSIFNRVFAVCLGGGARNWLQDFMFMFRISPADIKNNDVRSNIYKKIEELRPAWLIGPASLVSALTEYMAEDKFDSSALFAAELTTEPILLEDRSYIGRKLGVPVLNTFSCSEAGPVGFECPQFLGRFHLYAQRIIMEVVDEKGMLVRPGDVGDLVITVLDRKILPIIRYAIGDRGKLVPDKCPCGRSTPLFEVESRREDKLILPSGKTISSVLLYIALYRAGIDKVARAYQVRQVAHDGIELLICPRRHSKNDKHNIGDEAEVNLRLALSEFFNQERMIIDFKYTDIIPPIANGKTLFFIPFTGRS